MRRADLMALLCLGVLGAPAAAQQPPPAAPAQPPVINLDEPKLVFEREVFTYDARGRRDPFMPLTGRNAGPLFSDLRLRMILYSEDPRQSVVSVSDASNTLYRLRRGDSVGNATVADIGPARVVFTVIDFGISRQEVLEMTDKGREPGR